MYYKSIALLQGTTGLHLVSNFTNIKLLAQSPIGLTISVNNVILLRGATLNLVANKNY